MVGGIALVIHGSNQNLLESLAGTVALILGLSCVSALNHEAWHRHLSASERVNDVLSGWILSPLLVADFEVQQRNHLQHHAYLGEDADPDGQLYRMSTKTFVLMLLGRAMVIPYLLKIAGLRQEASANRTTERLLRGSSLLRIALVHGIWFVAVAGGAWLVTGGDLASAAMAVLFGYLLPLMLASFMIAIRGHREHYVDEATAKTVTCDTDCVFIERWLMLEGVQRHACHHLFPEIPSGSAAAGKLWKASGTSRHYDGFGSPIAARATYFSAVPPPDGDIASSGGL
jgi:fatty acid desaturase